MEKSEARIATINIRENGMQAMVVFRDLPPVGRECGVDLITKRSGRYIRETYYNLDLLKAAYPHIDMEGAKK